MFFIDIYIYIYINKQKIMLLNYSLLRVSGTLVACIYPTNSSEISNGTEKMLKLTGIDAALDRG